MAGKNILITGATGFLGCRLAERLILGNRSFNVTCAIHRFSGPGLARLARLPVKFVHVDVLNYVEVEKIVEKCDIIVHLAYGTSGDENYRRDVTVLGTENILKAAHKYNIKKVINFSTAAVHGVNPDGPLVEESAPFEKSNDVYRSSKIEAEKIANRYYQQYELPVVTFRPPLIYGPYGAYWSARIAAEIKSGAILVNGGSGAANLVYVDNVVDAIFLAMEKDSGNGEAFFVVDDDDLTWKQVYEAYSKIINSHPPIKNLSVEEIDAIKNKMEPNDFKSWFINPILLVPLVIRGSFKSPDVTSKMKQIPWLRFAKKRLPGLLGAIKGEEEKKDMSVHAVPSSQLSIPNTDLIDLYSSKSKFSNDKIKRILGYRQRVTFEKAIDLIAAWLNYQRLIP